MLLETREEKVTGINEHNKQVDLQQYHDNGQWTRQCFYTITK